ncbi:MAG: tyrosine-type recombinase/integrase [Flavobacteriales bacterium]
MNYLLTEKRCSPHTIDSYAVDLAQFAHYCKSEFAIETLVEVSHQVVRSWLASLMEGDYHPSSVHRKLSAVNAYMRFQMKEGVIAANPARNIPKPKKPARLPLFVEEKGAQSLYHIGSSEQFARPADADLFVLKRDELIVTLLYETGIRQSELLGLKDSDMDASIGQIKVLGKRNKTRYVPLGKAMMRKIETYITFRNERFNQPTFESLIVTDKGKKVTKSLVYVKVKFYLSQVTTIQRKSPHVLRHTFATHMLNNGAELNVIKEILGHSSLAATQVYTHNSIEKLKSIHARMHPRNN